MEVCVANIMIEIEIQKESDREYSVSLGNLLIGAYYIGEGIVLFSSEGSVVNLSDLQRIITKLHAFELLERTR